jgi:hypothetical protein
MDAKYWIAQTVPDLFRDEPQNVGVFVSQGGRIAARFFGEVGDQLDGRKLRSLPYPDVYKQWVQHWRKSFFSGTDIEKMLKSSGNYRVKIGGEVSDIGADSAESLADYLYSLLISEGGLREALGGSEADATEVTLEKDLADEFLSRNIFGLSDPTVRHPVRRGVVITGRNNVEHRPAFVQENGHLCIMESVDFTAIQKTRSKDHAGLSAYIFSDMRAARPTLEAISIVKVTDVELELPDVDYAMRLLRNESDVVNWLNPVQRAQFLAHRVEVAHG